MSGELEELLVAIGTTNALGGGVLLSLFSSKHPFDVGAEGFLFVALAVKCVKSVPAYFAERLYKSMKVCGLLVFFLVHFYCKCF